MQKYMRVYMDLCEKIDSGVFKEGALLPFEKTLEEDYQTSRGTIRKALEMLESKGMILKVKGKGSIVQKRDIVFSLNDIKSLKEQSSDLQVNIRTEVIEMELLDDAELLSQLFPEEDNSKIWRIVRVRYFDEDPSIIDIDYILQSRVSELSLSVCATSLYDYLENKLSLYPKFARRVITVERANATDVTYLKIDSTDKVVVVESNVYDSNNSHFQVSISKHRSDTFRFSCVAYR